MITNNFFDKTIIEIQTQLLARCNNLATDTQSMNVNFTKSNFFSLKIGFVYNHFLTSDDSTKKLELIKSGKNNTSYKVIRYCSLINLQLANSGRTDRQLAQNS